MIELAGLSGAMGGRRPQNQQIASTTARAPMAATATRRTLKDCLIVAIILARVLANSPFVA
jgi:hypothetical protein